MKAFNRIKKDVVKTTLLHPTLENAMNSSVMHGCFSFRVNRDLYLAPLAAGVKQV